MSFELQVFVKTSGILLAAGLLSMLLRQASAALRHAMWVLALLAVLAFPVASRLLPAVELPILSEAHASVVVPISMPAASQIEVPIIESPSPVAVTLPVPERPPSPKWSWRQALTFAWILGAVVVLAGWLHARWQLRQLKRASRLMDDAAWMESLAHTREELGVRCPVQLLIAPEHVPPMTWGVTRRLILLPSSAAEWSPARRRLVLEHEMAHVKRRDGLWQLLSQLACCLYWFNPLVWYAVRRLHAECERACDDTVIRLGAAPADYANHLVDIARGLNSRFARTAVSMAHPSQLKSRILAILDGGIRRRTLSRCAALVLLAITGLVTLSTATIRVTQMVGIAMPAFALPSAVTPEPVVGLPPAVAVQLGPTGSGDASIDGHVLSAGTNDPVAGARVILNTDPISETPLVATADDTGHFEFHKVASGNYQLLATHDGYVRGLYGQHILNGPGGAIAVAAGQSLKSLNVTLTPMGSISGEIRDRFGEPVANVFVRALRVGYQDGRKSLRIVETALTNDLGEYRLYYLEPGQYSVSAMPAEGPVPVAGNSGQIARLTVLPGSSFSGAAPTTVITAAAAYATQGILSPSETGETYVPLYFPGVADPGAATQIDLKPGGTFKSANFVVSEVRAARIRGQIRDAAGQPKKGVSAILVPQGDVPVAFDRYGVTHDDGSFEFRGIPPGAYDLIALSGTLPRAAPATAPAGVGGVFIGRGTVTSAAGAADTRLMARSAVRVGNADVENVSLTLQPGFRINGKLIVEGLSDAEAQSMMNGLVVQLIPSGQLPQENDSDAVAIRSSRSFSMPGNVAGDGAFTITGAFTGVYRIAIRGASQLPQNVYVKSARIDGVDAMNPRFLLEREPRGELEVVLATDPGSLHAAVVDERQGPAKAVTVVLIPDAAHRQRYELYFKAVTDSAGKAAFENLPPGDYEAYAMESVVDGAWWDPGFPASVSGQGKSIRIAARSAATVELKVIR